VLPVQKSRKQKIQKKVLIRLAELGYFYASASPTSALGGKNYTALASNFIARKHWI
jgi:hypothetical protein